MKRIILTGIVIAMGLAFWNLADRFAEQEDTKRLASLAPMEASLVPVGGVPHRSTVVMQKAAEVTLSPEDIAKDFLEQHRNEWQLQAHHDFKPLVYENPLGTVVSFNVYQDDIPVSEMRIDVKIDKDRNPSLVEKTYLPSRRVETGPDAVLDPEEVKAKVLAERGTEGGELPISRILYADHSTGELALAYVIHSREKSGQDIQIVVNAASGQIVRRVQSRAEFPTK